MGKIRVRSTPQNQVVKKLRTKGTDVRLLQEQGSEKSTIQERFHLKNSERSSSIWGSEKKMDREKFMNLAGWKDIA